ncbi:MAG: hypothetical protein RIU46_21045 [Deltaproteobacteria bacterium]
MASDFDPLTHMRRLLADLRSDAERQAGVYGHRGGRGEFREEVIRGWLRTIFPSTISVTKGEVLSSAGHRSAEFDVVLSARSPSIWIFGTEERRVHPVEEVLEVIEVKTTLQRSDVSTFSTNLDDLVTFPRYYLPTSVLHRLVNEEISWITDQDEVCISAADESPPISRISGGILAFEGPTKDTLKNWLNNDHHNPRLAWIYVLGGYLVTRRDVNEWKLHTNPDAAILGLLGFFGARADILDRWTQFRPSVGRYHELAEARADAELRPEKNET